MGGEECDQERRACRTPPRKKQKFIESVIQGSGRPVALAVFLVHQRIARARARAVPSLCAARGQDNRCRAYVWLYGPSAYASMPLPEPLIPRRNPDTHKTNGEEPRINEREPSLLCTRMHMALPGRRGTGKSRVAPDAGPQTGASEPRSSRRYVRSISQHRRIPLPLSFPFLGVTPKRDGIAWIQVSRVFVTWFLKNCPSVFSVLHKI